MGGEGRRRKEVMSEGRSVSRRAEQTEETEGKQRGKRKRGDGSGGGGEEVRKKEHKKKAAVRSSASAK